MTATVRPTLSSREAAVQMRGMLFGHLLSRALCTVAALGVPDLLGDGPLTADEVARRTGADPGALRQLLDALTAFEVFDQDGAGSYRLTALGAALRSDAEATALPTALLAGAEIGQAWQALPTAIRTGRPAFDGTFGTDFFTYLDRNPALRDVFDQSQQADMALEIDHILTALDLAGNRRLVDVGGGDGTLLAAALRAHPQLTGALLDLPGMTVKATAQLAGLGVADRCEVVAGDFLTAVPAGGDVYVLREILHDWDDERCVRILTACRRAMRPGSRLAVVELVAEDRPADAEAARFTALMTLYMLSVLPGRERTGAELERLLHAAGLDVRAVHPLAGQKCLIEAVLPASVSAARDAGPAEKLESS